MGPHKLHVKWIPILLAYRKAMGALTVDSLAGVLWFDASRSRSLRARSCGMWDVWFPGGGLRLYSMFVTDYFWKIDIDLPATFCITRAMRTDPYEAEPTLRGNSAQRPRET